MNVALRRLFGSVLLRPVDHLPHRGVEQLRGQRPYRRARPVHCDVLRLEVESNMMNDDLIS